MILAATDLTPRSAAVAERAMLLAHVLGAEVRLVHASEGGPALAKLSRRPPRPADPAGELARIAGDAGARMGLPVPATEVVDATGPGGVVAALAARASEARLIVMGLHRERRVLDLLRLTTLERVVLAAPAPVLIAHRLPVSAYARVLGATDFAPASAAAMAMAARLAPGASFHAVHALRLPLGASAMPGSAQFDAALTRAEMLRAVFERAPGMPRLTEPSLIVPGAVHEVLAYRHSELDADLICVGTHSGRDPGVLGNYARDLMRAPPADLLVAKPG